MMVCYIVSSCHSSLNQLKTAMQFQQQQESCANTASRQLLLEYMTGPELPVSMTPWAVLLLAFQKCDASHTTSCRQPQQHDTVFAHE